MLFVLVELYYFSYIYGAGDMGLSCTNSRSKLATSIRYGRALNALEDVGFENCVYSHFKWSLIRKQQKILCERNIFIRGYVYKLTTICEQ